MIRDYDENYFEKINTPEKAYWLGYILGDGGINKTKKYYRNRLTFYCKSLDKSILENFCKAIKAPRNKIKTEKRQRKNFNGYSFNFEAVYLYFDSKKLVNDLLSLNIKNKWKYFSNYNLKRAYCLGFLDADGGFTQPKHKHSKAIYLQIHGVGEKDILKGFSKDLGFNGNYIYKENNIYRFRKGLSKSKEMLKIYNFLYKDINYYPLQRKKEKIFSIIEKRIKYEEEL